MPPVDAPDPVGREHVDRHRRHPAPRSRRARSSRARARRRARPRSARPAGCAAGARTRARAAAPAASRSGSRSAARSLASGAISSSQPSSWTSRSRTGPVALWTHFSSARTCARCSGSCTPFELAQDRAGAPHRRRAGRGGTRCRGRRSCPGRWPRRSRRAGSAPRRRRASARVPGASATFGFDEHAAEAPAGRHDRLVEHRALRGLEPEPLAQHPQRAREVVVVAEHRLHRQPRRQRARAASRRPPRRARSRAAPPSCRRG